jgi:hypothetical protein
VAWLVTLLLLLHPVFFAASGEDRSAVPKTGTCLHQKKKIRAQNRSSPDLLQSWFFCNQVFFDYNPSSSASLLSSVGITTRRQ